MYGLILTPAFGRDYADRAECMDDWEAGKDFRILDGPYCSKRDIPLMGVAGFGIVTFTNNAGLALATIELSQRREPTACL